MQPEEFQQTLSQAGIALNEHQMQQFVDYFELLVATNQQVNLTSITEQGAVYLKHFYDSLTPAMYFKQLQTEPLTICDVGAGAGFPSIPLKIAFPALQVTIVDSLNKRIAFLQNLVDQLGLTGVTLVHDRAETFGAKNSEYRESFDIVTARAVARLNILSELCVPLVKVQGYFIAMKADKSDAEVKQATAPLELLGAKVVAEEQFTLPTTTEKRSIVIVQKLGPTPTKYPRRPGMPSKKPLA